MRDVKHAVRAERITMRAFEPRLAEMPAEAEGAFLAVAVGESLATGVIAFSFAAAGGLEEEEEVVVGLLVRKRFPQPR